MAKGKVYFVYSGHRYTFGECNTPDGETLEGGEMAEVLQGLFEKHPEIFLHPKEEGLIRIENCIMENTSSGHIIDARVLKGGLSVPEDGDVQSFYIREDGLFLDTGV